MAPRSPTHAFDPTPALERNRENYSPLNDPEAVNSKSVKFSDPPVLPSHGRHSIATTDVPLLAPVSSASRLPKQEFQITNPTPGVDITAYIEQCRNLNEQLRQAHESERRTWSIERTALQARIADLEFTLNKSRDPKRRSSNESSATSAQPSRLDFNGVNRMSSEPFVPMTSPVWKGPESTPPATRVFSYADDAGHLPRISEDEPLLPSLSREISPASVAPRMVENVPVPIEKVDHTLDGITLKSAALTSSFVTKITSPQFGRSPALSPSARPKNGFDGLWHLEMNGLLPPLDEKLKRHAGHTPLVCDETVSTGNTSVDLPTPQEEKPTELVPTKRPPTRPAERSDSYFLFMSGLESQEVVQPPGPALGKSEAWPRLEPTEDPSLKGPLMLDPGAESEASTAFLEKVNTKLMEAVQKPKKDSALSDSGGDLVPDAKGEATAHLGPDADDEMPQLKLKDSKNFGSAWGGDVPGRI